MTEQCVHRAEKARIRAEVRAQREAMSAADRSGAASGLTEQLIALTASLGARSLSCFLATSTEPETRPFLAWARAHDLRVILPVAAEDGVLNWVAANGADDPGAYPSCADDAHPRTVTGRFGIEEPVGAALPPLAVAEIDLMIIPACAVDRTGTRLGWGLGYFDRALAALPHRPPVFAVVHDSELVDALPVESHDIPVAGVITPTRVITFG